MLRDIILKELLDLLLSLRALLTAVTIIALMTVSAALFVDDYEETVVDYQQQVEENLDDLRRKAAGEGGFFQALSWRDQQIYRLPSPLAFLAEGGEKDLPNALRVDAFLLHSPMNLQRDNPFLWSFRKLDWSVIVMVVLSFAAMVLSFDGVSGERESQVLPLVMANAVTRHNFLFGKFIGIGLCLAVLLLAGGIIHLLVLSLSGGVRVSPELILAMAAGFLLSCLYVSIFVWLGLLVSSRCRESASSLVICLLMWALLVVAIPNLGGMLASRFVAVPSAEQEDKLAWDAWSQARSAYAEAHPELAHEGLSGNWSPGENLSRAILMDEARERVYADAWIRRLAQARFGRDVTRASPAAVYRYAMESLAGSGIEHSGRFYEQARRYREALRDFLLRKYPGNPAHAYDNALSRKAYLLPLHFDEIPKFQEKPPSLTEALNSVAADGLLLLLWGVVAFLAAYVSFLRSDIS